ncbi:MAG: PadR family transcriptional regulator [Planctomycetes bacterium]|nr:PadR family transcriptional regulator [Planctomycetota bacterium]
MTEATPSGAFDRELLRGSLDLMVLAELCLGERYGYQILAALREKSDGRVDLRAGTLYPILHKLEADGCVTTRWDPSAGRDRKWYTLTDRGRQRLTRHAREWLDYSRCLHDLIRPLADSLGLKIGDAPTKPRETSA